MRLIRRLKNYMYYDTIDKMYLTLSELHELLKTGITIEVITYDGQNITEKTINKARKK